MAENKKIVRFPNRFRLNIGVVFFGIIFIYIVFNIFSYFTTEHISSHEVQQGTIAENNLYRGLILREETIFTSEYSGYVDYYVHDTAKSSYNHLVYSIDENGDVANKIDSAQDSEAEFSTSDYATIKETIAAFAGSYDAKSYYQVYPFENQLDSQLMEALNKSALDSLSDYVATAQSNNTFHLVNATQPGVVVYYTDGYENVTTDTYRPNMLNELNYQKVSLKQTEKVEKGNAVYKMITSEDWDIILQVSDATYNKLSDTDVVKIQFKKDGISCWVNFEFEKIDNQYYMILKLKDHMVRFANDRYVEVALLLDEESGLKIPNSAITMKEFYVVPKEYFLKGGNANTDGLLVNSQDKNGKTITTFIETSLYNETEESYYIDELDIHSGSVIVKPDSTETYTIHETDQLAGVYNVNKGYAVFKQIDVIYQSDAYSIIRTGTAYGISLYDHIALEGDKVEENEIIH